MFQSNQEASEASMPIIRVNDQIRDIICNKEFNKHNAKIVFCFIVDKK